jgi:tetratricopeptide (TPR) repeat protein
MKRLFVCAWSVIGSAVMAAAAVHVTLKDGDSFLAESAVPKGGKIQITLAGQQPRLIEASAIERIDLAEPAGYGDARAAYLAGDTVKTLQAMGKLRAELEPLKDVGGAREWWLESEFLRAHILLGQKRNKEVAASMKEIAADAGDPEAQHHAQVFLAHLMGLDGDPRKALEQLNQVILATTDPDTLADAWLFAGQHYAATNNHQAALLAYLRVPVFYPGKTIALAGAQIGAARAFVAIEEPARARATLRELVAKLPNTAEATEGRKLLAQVEKDLGSRFTEEESKAKK